MNIIKKLLNLTGTNHQDSKTKIILPPSKLRMGGVHFKDDFDFIAAAAADVQKLIDFCDLKVGVSICDWGCGAGRLAVGLKQRFADSIEYTGVDIQKDLIGWADTNLSGPSYKFKHLELVNERYNPEGKKERTIGLEDESVDVFYAYSVFSHLNAEDAASYLKLISKVLRNGGKAFITGFVEEDVPDWEENPGNYGPLNWSGPLHCTRFEKKYFRDLINKAQLEVSMFFNHQETDGQSAYILIKKTQS